VRPKDEAVVARVHSEQESEHQRLAYVALTRAQVRLYLPRYGDKVTAERSLYEPVQRCLEPLITRRDPRFALVSVPVGGAGEPPPPSDALEDLDVPAPPPGAPVSTIASGVPGGAIVGTRAGLAMLSYTRLAHAVDAARAIDPGDIDRDEVDATAEVAEGELPPGADSGLLLHDLFELVELEGVRGCADAAAWSARPEVTLLLAERARSRGIASTLVPHAARIVHATLTAPLSVAGGDPLPPLVDAPMLAREVEFTYPIPGAPVTGLVRGFLDALVAWDDELWVLDYKSDVLAGSDVARVAIDRVVERYGVQKQLYALAAARLRGARPFAGMLFVFVRYGVTVAVRTPEESLAGWERWLASVPTPEAPR
jgi:exodeoxyribonuclease V beta subunit